jgi:hypothetical protein
MISKGITVKAAMEIRRCYEIAIYAVMLLKSYKSPVVADMK